MRKMDGYEPAVSWHDKVDKPETTSTLVRLSLVDVVELAKSLRHDAAAFALQDLGRHGAL